jgi:hypothetical protein
MATTARHYKVKNDRNTRSDIVILLTMCTFAFVIFGAGLALKMTPTSVFNFSALFSSHSTKHVDATTTLGPVKLGSSLDEVRKLYEHAFKGITADGSITLAFMDGNDHYIVWYGEDGPLHIAYKIRQTRILNGVSEDDYIGSIAERYGAPSMSTCSKHFSDGLRDCQFSWWVPGEVRLDVNSRQDTHDTKQRLKITRQITDSRLEGRFIRTAQRTSVHTY